MLSHVVLFKLTENTEEKKAFMQEQIMRMRGKLDFLEKCEVGLNVSSDAKAYDVVAFFDFHDEEGLKRFATDPLHIDVVNTIKSNIADVKIIDYHF